MSTYLITNLKSGVSLGQYEAASKAEALDAMARDAGYDDYADLQAQVPSQPGEVVAKEV